MKLILFAISLAFGALGTPLLLSGSTENPTPLFWPENKLIPIQPSYATTTSDGMEFTITEFKNSALPFYSLSMSDWKTVPKLTFRKASVAFANVRNPDIKIGLSLVKSGDWLGDLDTNSLNRYVASLQNQNPERFTLLNAGTEFAPIFGSGFLLGSPYKLVRYHIASPEENGSGAHIWDFISNVDGTLFILSFECPDELAEINSRTPLMLLTSLARGEELE